MRALYAAEWPKDETAAEGKRSLTSFPCLFLIWSPSFDDTSSNANGGETNKKK
jgi:hypothetical protein